MNTFTLTKLMLLRLLIAMLLFCNPQILSAQLNFVVGSGTVGNSVFSFPAPFGNYYWGAKNQFVYRASELQALGMPDGNITAVAFNVLIANSAGVHSNFTISMKNSSNTNLTAWETGMTQVYGPANVTPVMDWNNFVLSTPFLWDGSSNIIVEVCFNSAAGTYNATTQWTSGLTGSPTRFYYDDLSTVCSSTAAGTSTNVRTDIRFTVQTLYAYDAGVTAITSPTTPGIPGSNNVLVTLKNFGYDTLQSATINWKVDGVAQTPYLWTGSLLQLATATAVNIGSFNFTAGNHEIKAWTSIPNGYNDSVPVNDTSEVEVLFCVPLSGTYTVGGTTADYSTISDAVDAVSLCGVSGPVTFNILPGTYNEQIDLEPIASSSTTNTITFQSSTQTASDVIIEFNATTSSSPYVWKLNGADNIRLKYLTLQCSNTSYARIVLINNTATNNEISYCHIIGPQVISTSDQCSGIYNQGNFSDNDLVISNNTIELGAYGIFANGTNTSTFETGLLITNNIINYPYYIGIQSYYQTAPVISGNQINMNNTSTTSYGIWGNYNQQQAQFLKNRIIANNVNTHYGIYFGNGTAAAGTEALIANNFVSSTGSGTGTIYGINNNASTNVRYFHNSVRIATTATAAPTCHAFYITGGSSGTQVRNCVLSNFAGGPNCYAIYANTTTGWTSNYNDLYSTGTNLGYWTSAKATLALWQTASSQDANSVSTNPFFFSPANLHTSNPLINNIGTPLTAVTTDIDGDTRNATSPDLGADEFTPPDFDAGITAMTAPLNAAPAGNLPVIISFFNFGLDTLFSVDLNWKVNGVLQTPFAWNDTLAPITGISNVTIGSYLFSAGYYSIQLWTSSPNDSLDIVNGNDTITVTLQICQLFSGTYSIGSAGDYPDIVTALAALNTCGVTDDVIFNIAPGTYTGQISFLNIPGVTDTSTVTFQAANGDSTSVIITHVVTTPNFIVKFNACSYITLKKLTIQAATGSTNSRCIDMTGNAHHNSILNCRIIGITATSTSNNYALYFSDNFADNYNTYSNNRFVNGSVGMYMYGTSTSPELGTVIANNVFENQYNQGILLYYQNGITVTGNTVNSTTTYYPFYGIYPNYCKAGPVITKNRVNVPNGGYGIHMYYCEGTAATRALVANNFISGSGTSTLYLLYSNYTVYIDYFHNSVNVYGTNTSSRAFSYTGASAANIAIKNNILCNNANGFAFYISSTIGWVGANSDYNDLYTSGSYLGYYSSNKATLANWQAALSGLDAHSVNILPNFASNVDLHIIQPNLNNLGTPLFAVTTDIDGVNRNQNSPDMGADEFSTGAFDIFGTITHAQCFGSADGSISVTIDGGISPYIYSWSNGTTNSTITGLTAGTYYVTVTDNSLEDESASFTVSQPTPVTPAMGITNASTFGGTSGAINLSISGGTSPYTFLWFSGSTLEDLTGLTAGNYLVTVTDSHNCSGTASGYLTSPIPSAWNQPYLASCTSTIALPVGVSILLNGLVPNPGSIIGVYYDSLGTPRCAGYVFYNGAPAVLTVQGNSIAPINPNGYVNNQVYNWKMQDAQSLLVGNATATYNISYPQTDQFICTGQSGIASLTGSTTVIQSIPIPLNWSIWSTYVVPPTLNMATVIQAALGVSTHAAVTQNLTIIKNYSGQVYWPALPLNTIGNINVAQGYQVKAVLACTLNILGLAVFPENYNLTIPQNWSIISYLRTTAASAITMTSTGVSNISNPYSANGTIVPWMDILKNGAGQVYWPYLNLNTIGTMKPGQGYQIKMRTVNWTNASYPNTYTITFPVNYRYPANSEALAKDLNPPGEFDQIPFLLGTGNNMTLGILNSAWPVQPTVGDAILVQNQDGKIYGGAEITGDNLAVTIWGDDEYTPETEGLRPNEHFRLIYRNADRITEQMLVADCWEYGTNIYSKDGMALITKLRFAESGGAWYFGENHPNPFNDKTLFTFEVPATEWVEIELFNLIGERVSFMLKGNYQPGIYQFEFDGSSLPAGSYLARMKAGSFMDSRKVLISR